MISMVKSILFIILIVLSSISNAKLDVVLDGYVANQVISRVGQIFYEELVDGWEIPVDVGTIVIKERPDNFAGNVVLIEINDELIYQTRIGFIPTTISEKAKEARSIIQTYIYQHNEALHDLEGIK